VVYQFPFFRIHEIVVASRGVSLSTDLLEELCTRGVRLSLLDSTGKPYAMLTSPMLSATVQARREQILAFNDARGLAFARAIVGVNASLTYGYGILYSQVWGAVLNAGLEPFAGFLHVDRPGKPSLVLDLTEEFRQPVVDRAVIAHVNLGEPIGMHEGFLDLE